MLIQVITMPRFYIYTKRERKKEAKKSVCYNINLQCVTHSQYFSRHLQL